MRFIQSLIAVLLLIFTLGSFNNAKAAGFVLTDHVNSTAPVHAQTSLLTGMNDHTNSLAVGFCSMAQKDLSIGGVILGSLGEWCGYGGGQTSGTGQFAIDVTTGGNIGQFPYSHWDLGYQTARTAGGEGQFVFGIGIVIPTSIGQ